MDNTKLKSRMSGKVQDLAKPVEVVGAVPDTSLAPVDSNYIALGNNTMAIIKDNLKHQPLSYNLFDVVKSLSGGATVFEVPELSGAEAEKELVGIVLDYTTPRPIGTPPTR